MSSPRALLESLANERGYYGFLAADELGTEYEFSGDSLQADESAIAELARRQDLLRARELFFVGQEGSRPLRVGCRRRVLQRGREAAGGNPGRSLGLAFPGDFHGGEHWSVRRPRAPLSATVPAVLRTSFLGCEHPRAVGIRRRQEREPVYA